MNNLRKMNKIKLLSITYIVLGILFYAAGVYAMLVYSPSSYKVSGSLKALNLAPTINVDLSTIEVKGNKHFEFVLMPYLFGTVFLVLGSIGIFFTNTGNK